MAIDPMMLDPMLGTFRNMAAEIHQKGLTGEVVDQMNAVLGRMEELGRDHTDFTAFSGQLMQENLYGQFSDYYGRALSAEAQAAQGDGGYDDAALLKQNVDALRQAVAAIQQAYQDQLNLAKSHDPAQSPALGRAAFDDSVELEVLNSPDLLMAPIHELIALGEQPGMTLPRFLRLQVEQGLDKAMEGTGSTRRALQLAVGWAKANPPTPYHLERAETEQNVFEGLAAAQPFGVPNAKEFSYASDDIKRINEPKIMQWEAVKSRWEDLLYDLSHWSLSYLSCAPSIDPWSLSGNPAKAVKRSRDTTPGLFRQRERLLHKYFGLDFMSVLKHPSFWWEVQWDYIGYSQEFATFLIERVYPQCQPFQHLDAETIQQREYFYGAAGQQGREGNPGSVNVTARAQHHYDGLFGQGRFLAKFGPAAAPQTAAAPWNWATFRHGN